MNTILWCLQGLLAAAMLGAGLMKLTKTKEEFLASGNMDWTEDIPEQQIKGIGALEMLAAAGLVLPAVLDVAPVLVAVAAVGVVLLMLGASATHLRRGEKQVLPINIVLLGLALFIAVERFGPQAF
jgi:hypothetical protein